MSRQILQKCNLRRSCYCRCCMFFAIWWVRGQHRCPSPGRWRPKCRRQQRRRRALIDLTGYWVSIVNEDWRWRMMTPAKGDYASVPLNAEGTPSR